jgi:uncharacterized PurR-regulated membrane protein YhhQ (DUF165 family)
MNKMPSYKIIAPFAAVYSLCLFIPTIDAIATMSITLFNYKFPFNIAVLIFPAIYPLSDSLTEVYGKNVAYYTSLTCYIAIILFSVVNNILLSHVDDKTLYSFIVKPSLIVTFVGPISYLITCYININLISKLKILMHEKHFIFRTFVCSTISGFIMSLIVQIPLNYKHGFLNCLKIFISIFILKTIATIAYAYLAKFLVILYRYVDGIELTTYNKNLALYRVDQELSS